MDSKPFYDENHAFILDFLQNTQNDYAHITISVKATIVQFLNGMHKHMLEITDFGKHTYSNHDIIKGQITQLQNCILDLNNCLTAKRTIQ